MDVIATTTRHVLLPAYARCSGSALLRHYRAYQASQHWPEERLRALQWSALQAQLRHAWERSPFHRARLRALGATPEDIRSFDDFARLPLLTKDDLRASAAALIAEGWDPSDLVPRRTGGSTGTPVRLHWDRAAEEAKAALTMRHDRWARFRVAARKAALWGNVEPRTTVWRKLTGVLHERTVFLDTLQMDERSMLAFAEEIRRTGTRLLFGHGHSIYHFARFVKDRGVDGLRFDGIISSAEMLPPDERRLVEEVFGPAVFDRYGCEEVGLIASECEQHGGLHLAAEGVHVEILGGGPAEPGRVVVTDLLNRATPLLRYEIGDLATTHPGRCPCGRGLPLIGRITGRTSDVLYTPEGRQISGISLLDTVAIHIPGFRQVQVVQEALDELTFNVVADGPISESSRRLLAEGVARYFGPSMRHRIVLVEKIPLTGRGKFQFSICKVTPPARGSVATTPAPGPAARAAPAPGRRPRSVAFVIFNLSGGGAEHVVADLSRRWADAGREVSVVTIASAASDVYALDPRVRRVALDLARDSRHALEASLQALRRGQALQRALRQLAPEVVVSLMPQTNVMCLLATAGTGLPVVVCERTEPHRSPLGRTWSLLRRAVYPRAAAVVVQTEPVARWARAFCPRVHVIPNFVERPARTAQALDTAGPKRLLAVGRLIPAKGFDLLLEAFARLGGPRPEWTLTILGEGPERPRLEALAGSLGIADRVSMPGFVASPLDHLAAAQAFVLSSRYEGFPNALLEAMACGLPVVSFDCPNGPADAITHGEDGLLVPPGDVAALAAALAGVMDDARERIRLGRNAERVVLRLGPERILPRWAELVDSVGAGA